jgi:hypothetical protein
VVRLGLMTPDEVATTMREEAETGRPFAELAVETGRLRAEDLARLSGEPTPVAASEPAPVPLPSRPPVAVVPDPDPLEPEAPSGDGSLAAEPETELPMPAAAEPVAFEPVAAIAHDAEVFVRLTSGERIGAGSYADQNAAERRARELMDALDGGGDWPCLDGRFVRPDAVVSIDVELPRN